MIIILLVIVIMIIIIIIIMIVLRFDGYRNEDRTSPRNHIIFLLHTIFMLAILIIPFTNNRENLGYY